jgi:hypothetical protein
MILGRGKVLFLSNLVYDRYGELANFPSGAEVPAVAVWAGAALIVAACLIVTGLRK